jgi:hypothetical protein
MKSIIRKRRASERGAALVEGAVMIPLFITITFGAFFAYNYGRAGIDVKLASRESAWTLAMANCGSAAANDSEVLPTYQDPNEGTSGGAASKTPITHDPSSSSLSTMMHGSISGGGFGSFMLSIINGFFNVISPLFPNPGGALNNQSETVDYRIPFQGNFGPAAYAKRSAASGGQSPSSHTYTANVTLFCNQAPTSGDHPLGVLNAIVAAADALVIAAAPSPDI